MKRTNPVFASKAACRAILINVMSAEIAGLWIPLAEVRMRTGWPADGSFPGAVRMHSAVLAAARDGVIEFKSGIERGRASVRLKVMQPPATPAPENV